MDQTYFVQWRISSIIMGIRVKEIGGWSGGHGLAEAENVATREESLDELMVKGEDIPRSSGLQGQRRTTKKRGWRKDWRKNRRKWRWKNWTKSKQHFLL